MRQAKGELHNAAQWYVDHGIPVFPLQPHSKKPATKHGFLDASIDPAQITEWWTQHEQANIGMPTGQISQRLLVDCDFRGECRARTRADVLELYGEWNDTAEVTTGTGGLHLYFTGPLGPMPKQIDAGIELKSDGGYAVLPPSIHPNGNPYVFDGVRGRETFLRLAQPPAWLVQSIANARSKHMPPADRNTDDDDAWIDGERNNRLASLAGKLRRDGLSPAALEAALQEENRRRCNPPLPDNEVSSIAKSIARYPAGPGRAVGVRIERLSASVDLLNALDIFAGRIRFTSFRRRGPLIIGTTDEGCEVVWPTTSELGQFTKSQAIISDATNIYIPSPPHGFIRSTWDEVAALILRITGNDHIAMEPVLKEETREQLRLMWRRSGQPIATDNVQFIAFMRAALHSPRNPHAESLPSCVFVAEESCWVHVSSFRWWISIPVLTNQQPPLVDVRNGLTLLGFEYHENLTRRAEGDSETACLWQGPMDVLVES
jgi:hypothetical protein